MTQLGSQDDASEAFCPGADFSCTDGQANFDIGRVPTYFSIASCSLSCLSSILIVVVHLCLKEARKERGQLRKIITLLAIADFFTAFGYLIAAGNFLAHYQQADFHSCQVFDTICQIQSSITTLSTLSSYAWTCSLALYLYLIVKGRQKLAMQLLPWENVIAWFIPILIALPLLIAGRLGYSPYATSNWCFIKDNNYKQGLKDNTITILLIFVGGKFWEIITYVVVIILYGITKRKFGPIQRYLRREAEREAQEEAQQEVQQEDQQEDQRAKQREARAMQREASEVLKWVLLIPLAFLGLRIWGTMRFFFSLAVSQYHDGCIPAPIQTVLLGLGVMQGIGDGGQGWTNVILYIFLPSTTRQKLFSQPLGEMLQRCATCLGAAGSRLQANENRAAINRSQNTGQEGGREHQPEYPQGEGVREQSSYKNPVQTTDEVSSITREETNDKIEPSSTAC